MVGTDRITKRDVEKKCDILHANLRIQFKEDGHMIMKRDMASAYFLITKENEDGNKLELCKVIYSTRNTVDYNQGDVVCLDRTQKETGTDVCFNIIEEDIERFTEFHYKLMFDPKGVLKYESEFYKGYKTAKLKYSGSEKTDTNAGSTEKKSVSKKVKELEEELDEKKKQLEDSQTTIEQLTTNIDELSKWYQDVRNVTYKVPVCMKKR